MSVRGLRIGMVVPRYAPLRGGVETFTEQAAARLAAQGAQVTVITQWPRGQAMPAADGGPDPASADSTSESGCVWVERHPLPVGALFDLPAPAAVAAATAPGRFDVLWTHSYHTPLAWLTAERAGRDRVPQVHTPHYHGTGHTTLRALLHRPYRLAGRRLLSASQTVLVGSEAEAALLRRHFDRELPAGKLVVAPLPVDDPRAGRPPTPAADPPIVLSVARQEPYKRTDLLVRAVAELRRRGEPVRLVVVGDGSALTGLRRLAAELRAADGVTFAGLADDDALARWWSVASAYATASEQESFGIGLGQAFRAGLPAVASDIPAHREVAGRSGPATAVEFVGCPAPGDTAALGHATAAYAAAIRRCLAAPGSSADRAANCALDTAQTAASRLHGVLAAAASRRTPAVI